MRWFAWRFDLSVNRQDRVLGDSLRPESAGAEYRAVPGFFVKANGS